LKILRKHRLAERNGTYLLEFELVAPDSPGDKVAMVTLQVEASVGEYTRRFEIEGMGIIRQDSSDADKPAQGGQA